MLLANGLELFAQAGNKFGGGAGGGGGAGAADDAVIAVIVVVAVVFMVIGFGVQILYLMMLSKTLSRCASRNRTMEPGQVWLNLIPCFNLVWLFITVNRVAESLEEEFYDRRLPREGDFGKGLGITYLSLYLAGMIPYIGALFSIGGLICWIMYWVKISGFSKQLAEDDGYGRGSDNERDDEYDDRRRRQDDDDQRDYEARDDRDRDRDDRNDDDYRPRGRR